MYINIEYNIKENKYINKIGWHTLVYTFFLINMDIKRSIEPVAHSATYIYTFIYVYI